MNAFLAQALRDAHVRRAGERELSPAVLEEAPELDALAIAAARGDSEAVGRLYDALVGPIYRYVAVRVRRREDAEDLTQLVFERIVASLPRYRHRGRPFDDLSYKRSVQRTTVADVAPTVEQEGIRLVA